MNPAYLCRKHLLGEHRELHAIWTVIKENKKGYLRHPETIRWKNKMPALYKRHELLVKEMETRGYKHHSPLSLVGIKGIDNQVEFVDKPTEQFQILQEKNCECLLIID